MLDEEQIRATIVQRLMVSDGSCNSHHLNCIQAQLRALVYVLGNGDPPPIFNWSAIRVCEAAGIPYINNGDGTIEWSEEWLSEHGFVIDGDDAHHPTLGRHW